MGFILGIDFPLEIAQWLQERALGIAATALAFLVLYIISHWLLTRFFNAKMRLHKLDTVKDARAKTLRLLLIDALRIVVLFSALMTILPQAGVNPTALAAGSFGFLAVFGIIFQQTLQDIGAGLTVFLADRFHIDEEVSIAGLRGKVEYAGLRIVVLRNIDGEECTVPYRNVGTIVNHSRKN